MSTFVPWLRSKACTTFPISISVPQRNEEMESKADLCITFSDRIDDGLRATLDKRIRPRPAEGDGDRNHSRKSSFHIGCELFFTTFVRDF
jgi:hypothetical protein